MENLNTAAVETTEVAAEKIARIALPVIAVEDYKALEFKGANIDGAATAIITTGDINEYAQIAAVVKSCEKVLYSSGNKTCTIIIDGSLERNANQVALLNPELKGKVVAIHVTYNGAEKLRLSAKTTGTAKAKKTAKGSFFDLDLANVIDLDDADYVYGKEGSDFSRETNTKIARVVKALLPYGVLYSDEDKSGFHKNISKIPTDVRVKEENYVFFFKFDEIKAKLQSDVVVKRIAANLITKATPKDAALSEEKIAELNVEAATIAAELKIDADAVIADIIAIINFYYPTLVVNTERELVLECSKSTFASLKSEKLVFDAATKTVVSKKEEADRLKAEAKADRVAKAAEKAAKTKADKAAKAAEVSEEATETVDLGAPVAATIAPATSIDLSSLVAPSVIPTPTAPATEVVLPQINAASLLNTINPTAGM